MNRRPLRLRRALGLGRLVQPKLEQAQHLRAMGLKIAQDQLVAAHGAWQAHGVVALVQPLQRQFQHGLALQGKDGRAAAHQLRRRAGALAAKHGPVDADGDLPGQVAVKAQAQLPHRLGPVQL